MVKKFGLLSSNHLAFSYPAPSDLPNLTRATFTLTASSDSAFATAVGRSAQEGDLYYNTSDKQIRFHNGTSFQALGASSVPGLRNWLSGLQMGNTGLASYLTRVDISPGSCRDDADTKDIISDYTIPMFKSKTAGHLSLDTGTYSNSTWYYIWLCYKDTPLDTGTTTSAASMKLIDSGATFVTSGVAAGMAIYNTTDATWTRVSAVDSETQLSVEDNVFASGEGYIIAPKAITLSSLSATAPTLPSGYSYKRRVGAMRTNSGGNFTMVTTIGVGRTKKVMNQDMTVQLLNGGTATSWTTVSCVAGMPPTTQKGLLQVYFGGSATVSGHAYLRPKGSSSSESNHFYSEAGANGNFCVEQLTDSSNDIEYYVGGTSPALYIFAAGYYEEL
jgi:hypothetical protein